MCYILYGGMNSGVNKKDYDKLKSNWLFSFRECTETEIKQDIDTCACNYRMTYCMCDCDTAVGRHERNNDELTNLSAYIQELQKLRGIKHIFIAKNWWGDKVEKEQVIHIDDVDIIQFLADIECKCLYKIQLFQKYY